MSGGPNDDVKDVAIIDEGGDAADIQPLGEAGAFSTWQERRAEQSLAAATTPDQLQDFAAKAEAMRRFLRSSKRSLAQQNAVARLRLRALRKLGTLLASMPKRQGKRLHDVTASLADLGITKRDSSKWQKLAAIPQGLFDETCAKVEASGKPLTEASFAALIALRAAAEEGPPRLWTVEQTLARVRAVLANPRSPLRHPEAREAIEAGLRSLARDVADGLDERGTR
jgi:hypothetical protein